MRYSRMHLYAKNCHRVSHSYCTNKKGAVFLCHTVSKFALAYI